jgi:UDP-N-acetylmuramate dehydrogenase
MYTSIYPEEVMTIMTDFQQNLTAQLPNLELRVNEPMAKHTSFRIGGPVEIMAFPQTTAELAEILKKSALLDVKPVILGAGTNVLAPDAGMNGLVICLKDCLEGMEQVDDTTIRVMAGVTMTRAAVFAANLGLGGLEFAHGIPGTVGGGVYMNAGAYGGEICQVCKSVDVMDFSGNVRTFTNEEMGFSYRHSILEELDGIVISAEFVLVKRPVEEIREKMKELMGKRSASQPLDKPSAGSAFKRPVGGYAAALIDQAGLKGFAVGDAAISEKHAGFAVNLGHATADDVKQLLAQVSDVVFEKSGIRLEPEVRIW